VSSGAPIAATTHYPRFEEDNGSLEWCRDSSGREDTTSVILVTLCKS
jgi:hypothetical protein